ncbi:MAG: NADPH-dependent FMN reductase [Holosporaceae bacterium]
MTLSIGILSGSYRPESQAKRLGLYLQNAFCAKNAHVAIVDAKEHDVPLLDKTYAADPKGAAKNIQQLHELFKSLDAFVLVSAEYNHLPVPGLLNMLNFFYTEYHHKPSGLVTYSTGNIGGARVEPFLRTIADTLGMPSIAPLLSCARVHELLDPAGNIQNASPNHKAGQAFLKQTDIFVSTLMQYAKFFYNMRQENSL